MTERHEQSSTRAVKIPDSVQRSIRAGDVLLIHLQFNTSHQCLQRGNDQNKEERMTKIRMTSTVVTAVNCGILFVVSRQSKVRLNQSHRYANFAF